MKPIRPLVENRAASDGTTNKIRCGLPFSSTRKSSAARSGHEAARRFPHADVKGDEIDAALNVCGRSLASLGANRAASSNAAVALFDSETVPCSQALSGGDHSFFLSFANPRKRHTLASLSPHRQATMRSRGAQCERSSAQGGSRDAHFAVTVYSRAILASEGAGSRHGSGSPRG